MNLPPWAIPAVVLAYVGLRITFAFRSRRPAPGEVGRTWFQTVPVWIRVCWAALALAMVTLAVWNPRKAGRPGSVAPADGGFTYAMANDEILRRMKLDPAALTHTAVNGPDGTEDDYRDATNWVMITHSAETLSVSRLEPKDHAQAFTVHRP